MSFERRPRTSITFGSDGALKGNMILDQRTTGLFDIQQVHDPLEDDYKIVIRQQDMFSSTSGRAGRTALVINYRGNAEMANEFYISISEQELEQILAIRQFIMRAGER